MLRPRVIPVLLMNAEGLLKTSRFSDPKYVGDPINAVKVFNEKEVDELVILDIDAWKNLKINVKRLKNIAREARMPLCYGGGISSVDVAENIIQLGYEKVAVGRAAILDHDFVSALATRIGSQSVVASIDVQKRNGVYEIMLENGTKKTNFDLIDLCVSLESAGVGEIVLNSIDREGSLTGYDLEMANIAYSNLGIPVTVNGGCGSVEHMNNLIDQVGMVGLGVGSFFVFKGRFRAVILSYNKPVFT
jgi:cyclase